MYMEFIYMRNTAQIMSNYLLSYYNNWFETKLPL